jgi:hypothetical protein
MRQGQQNRRGRGRNNNNNNGSNHSHNPNRKGGQNPLTRSFESNGPDVKIRGTPHHIAEKYLSLARDAHTSGDPVLAENYLQHAEHYTRIIITYREQQYTQGGGDPAAARVRQPMPGDSFDAGDDFGDDDGDDAGGEMGQQPIAPVRGNEPQPRMFDPQNGQPAQPTRFDDQPVGGQPAPYQARDQQRDGRPQRGEWRGQPRQGGDRDFNRGPRRERYNDNRNFGPDRNQDRNQDRNPDRSREREPQADANGYTGGSAPREGREPREHREPREFREPREPRDVPREMPEIREPREAVEAREPRIEARPEPRPEPIAAPVIEPRAERPVRQPKQPRDPFGDPNEQPEFLRRPVRRTRREATVAPLAAEGIDSPPPEPTTDK